MVWCMWGMGWGRNIAATIFHTLIIPHSPKICSRTLKCLPSPFNETANASNQRFSVRVKKLPALAHQQICSAARPIELSLTKCKRARGELHILYRSHRSESFCCSLCLFRRFPFFFSSFLFFYCCYCRSILLLCEKQPCSTHFIAVPLLVVNERFLYWVKEIVYPNLGHKRQWASTHFIRSNH